MALHPFALTRSELYETGWSQPVTRLANESGISSHVTRTSQTLSSFTASEYGALHVSTEASWLCRAKSQQDRRMTAAYAGI